MSLCDPCKAKHDAWLDYRVSPRMKIASGASRDDTVEGVADARRARFEEWRNTIRNQQAAIRDICDRHHRGSDPVIESASDQNG